MMSNSTYVQSNTYLKWDINDLISWSDFDCPLCCSHIFSSWNKILAISDHLWEFSWDLSLICVTRHFCEMFFKIIICLLIAFDFHYVKCKPWSDQNSSHPAYNPYYIRDHQGEIGFNFSLESVNIIIFNTEPTTSTVKPLYPTLYPTSMPQYRPNYDSGQSQGSFFYLHF